MPTYLERKINQAWANCFVQGNANYLPSQMPTSQAIPETGPYDTGTPIPDLWILLGRVPVGHAQGTITGGDIYGLDSIEPDPNQPQIAFGTNDATASISVKFTALTLDGDWVITQTMDDTTGCAGPKFAAVFRGAGDDGSDVLYKVRDDLKARGGAMGAWYINEYYLHTAALKAVLDDPDFQQAVDQYNGNEIWQLIVSGVTSGTSDVPPALQGDALALVAAAAQYANDAALTNAIDQAMNYVPAYIGKTYDEVLTAIASQTPPSSAAAARHHVAKATTGVFTQTWTGSFDGTAAVTATIDADIVTGQDGAPPTITVTSITLAFNSLSLSFGGANFDSAVTAWLMTVFKSKVESALEKAVSSQYANSDDTKKKVGNALTSAVAAIWNS